MNGSTFFVHFQLDALWVVGQKKTNEMDPSTWISALTCAFTLAVVIVSAVSTGKTVKSSQEMAKQQMQISMFAEFTRRYQEIMLHIRQDGNDKAYYQTLYIDLCSEEFFMHNEGFLPKKVWDIWVEGMTHEIKDSYIDIWQHDKGNYNDDFQRFFDEILSGDDKTINTLTD